MPYTKLFVIFSSVAPTEEERGTRCRDGSFARAPGIMGPRGHTCKQCHVRGRKGVMLGYTFRIHTRFEAAKLKAL